MYISSVITNLYISTVITNFCILTQSCINYQLSPTCTFHHFISLSPTCTFHQLSPTCTFLSDEWLQICLFQQFPDFQCPHLPGKTIVKNMNKDFLEKRKKSLNTYLMVIYCLLLITVINFSKLFILSCFICERRPGMSPIVLQNT